MADPCDTQIFSAHLTPHRSLSQRNFRLLLMLFAAACFFTTLPFVLLGAWPIVGFMGADVLLFWWAFRANYRDARAYEDISLTPVELAVEKVSPKGARREWRFNPVWVRLVRHEHEEYGIEKLLVVSRGRGLEVASFLGKDAKQAFAGDLDRALAEARRGPRFD